MRQRACSTSERRFPISFEELNNPWPDRATLDNESSGSAQLKSTLWAEIAKEFLNSKNTYENVYKDEMYTANLKRKVETLDPNKFQQRSGVTPGSWIQGAWKHVVNRLSLHYSAWDVSGNQDEFGPDVLGTTSNWVLSRELGLPITVRREAHPLLIATLAPRLVCMLHEGGHDKVATNGTMRNL